MSKQIGVSKKTISKLVNERGSITPDMALRLSRAFNTTPDLWLNLQKKYDLWQAGQKSMNWHREQKVRGVENQIEQFYLSLSNNEKNEDRQWAKIAAESAKRLWEE